MNSFKMQFTTEFILKTSDVKAFLLSHWCQILRLLGNTVKLKSTILNGFKTLNLGWKSRQAPILHQHTCIGPASPGVWSTFPTFFSYMAIQSVVENHLWFLMSFTPFFRLPNLFVRSTCSRFLSRSFKSELKWEGNRTCGRDGGNEANRQKAGASEC